ncbi:myb-like dna-binding [Phytophthora cinnamomi]|uniref:myb-like dna-binding n=1 Tax=Phytophthora cinnamomi TaxID=4785 RepID=UPI003559D43B|nr:myb-like dna-binding [Phytophthora cinnamomi]
MSELHQAKLVPTQFTVPKPGEHAWSPAEQRRFWEAIQRFPQGPWTAIAAYVGSKSTRQAMTHAQKLRQKLSRWKRRVRSDSVSSACSTGSNNSTASASVTTPVDAGEDPQSPPMSPTEYGEIAKLSIMDHIQEEDDEKKSLGDDKDDDCEPMDIKSEFKDEVHQFGDHDQVHDAHDDRYLEHLLTDIEPVLEHVAHFTTGGHGHGADEVHTRPVSTTDYGTEQAVYFTHNVDMAASEHKTMELSWNQHHQDPVYYQQQQQQQLQQLHYQGQHFGSMHHYSPTESDHRHHHQQQHQPNYHHHL